MLEENSPTDSNEYETPREFWNRLHAEFRFDIDAFSNGTNAKLPLHFTPERSAFEHHWGWSSFGKKRNRAPVAFSQPPYSSNILGRAVERTFQQSRDYQMTCVTLIPPSISSQWWHGIVMQYASEVRMVEGRIAFEYNGKPIVIKAPDGKLKVGSNRGDSVVVVFRPGLYRPVYTSMAANL